MSEVQGVVRVVRGVSVVTLAFVFALVVAASSEAQPGNLKFFKNYIITGGHAAAGVALKGTGVNGFAVGTITIPSDPAGAVGVPDGADIIGAFLYWQTVTTSDGNGASGAQFNNHDISVIAKNLNPWGSPPCWASGGATGGGSAKLMKTYRADVLPFLPPGADGRRTAIGDHVVRLPDSGSGNVIPSTAGASLIVIYRDPKAPLTATVMYDGGHTMNQGTPSFAQTLQGWYQAANGAPLGSMTQVVANGQPNFTESLTVSDAVGALLFSAVNPFVGPYWDTYHASVPLPAGSQSVNVNVTPVSSTGSFDCLSWGAVVLTTPVQDTDGDGLIDRLETQGTSGTVFDPNGLRLPDLYAMGARPDVKDLFVEFGFMRSTAGYTNPLQTVPAGHTHLPSKKALDMVATAFRNAPVDPLPGGGYKGIRLHYDAGGNYQPPNIDPATALPYPALPSASQCQSNWVPSCAVIPVTLAEGGEFIEETPCVPSATRSCLFKDYPGPLPCSPMTTCRFSDFPGTVGWKSGYQVYKNEPLSHRKTAVVNGFVVDAGPDEAACHAAETDVNPDGTPNLTTTCVRRSSPNRRGLFHYALWAHAVGLPRAEVDDPSTPIDETRTPRNVSGFADYAGDDLMISLGLWDGAVGSTFMQASTAMHELGHNLGLRHGGKDGEPNCKPNHESVMNYLFQVRGLITATGEPQIGFSNQQLPALNESSLSEQAGLGTMQWRTRWFAPWSSSYVDMGLLTTPATKRCNGAPVAGEVMARIDGSSVSGPIDWQPDGVISSGPVPPQDLNFSGGFESLAAGTNDWSLVDLRQVGNGRNVGGWSVDSGFWDSGFWDSGISDPGFWDSGFWDSGFWDSGFWDSGFWDSGFWDSGVEGDTAPPGEVDRDTAEAVGNPPATVSAVQVNKDVLVSWTPPNVGADKVQFYEIYRIQGSVLTPATFATRVAVGAPQPPPTKSVLDLRPKKGTYLYVALAQFQDGRRSTIVVSQPVVVN